MTTGGSNHDRNAAMTAIKVMKVLKVMKDTLGNLVRKSCHLAH